MKQLFDSFWKILITQGNFLGLTERDLWSPNSQTLFVGNNKYVFKRIQFGISGNNWKSAVYRHCKNEGKRHESLRILAGKEWLFPKFFFLCNKLLAGAKEQLISNVVSFYRDVLKEGKKIRNVCCDFLNLMSQSL